MLIVVTKKLWVSVISIIIIIVVVASAAVVIVQYFFFFEVAKLELKNMNTKNKKG